MNPRKRTCERESELRRGRGREREREIERLQDTAIPQTVCGAQQQELRQGAKGGKETAPQTRGTGNWKWDCDWDWDYGNAVAVRAQRDAPMLLLFVNYCAPLAARQRLQFMRSLSLPISPRLPSPTLSAPTGTTSSTIYSICI